MKIKKNAEALLKQFPAGITALSLYNTASQWAEKGCPEEAEAVWDFIIRHREYVHPNLVGGALFKKGERALMARQNPRASLYFKECLEWIPHHFKAAVMGGCNQAFLERWLTFRRELIAPDSLRIPSTGDDGGKGRKIGKKQVPADILGLEIAAAEIYREYCPPPGSPPQQKFKLLEEQYRRLNDHYQGILPRLSVKTFNQWLALLLQKVDTLYREQFLPAAEPLKNTELLFWTLCVLTEFGGQHGLSKRMAVYFLEILLHSGLLSRHIRHLGLIPAPVGAEGTYLVSIILAYYNAHRFVEETLASISRQTYRNMEVIIADDGSSEASKVQLGRILKKYSLPGLRVLHLEHKDQPSALNAALENARGELILPLDCDDQIAARYLESTVAAFQGNPQLDVVYTLTAAYGFENRLSNREAVTVPQVFTRNQANITALVRKILFQRFGGYDPRLGNFEDWERWITFAKNGARFKRIYEPLFFYRQLPSSRGNTREKTPMQVKLNIMKKHPDLYRLPLEAELCYLDAEPGYIPPYFLQTRWKVERDRGRMYKGKSINR